MLDVFPLWMQVLLASCAGILTVATCLRLIPDGIKAIQQADDKRKQEIEAVVDLKMVRAEQDIKAHISEQVGGLKAEMREVVHGASEKVAEMSGTLNGIDNRLGRVENRLDRL